MYPSKAVSKKTIVIDASKGYSEEKVSAQARKHFFGSSDSIEFCGGGILLTNNLINYYHVQSVRYGLVVASLNKMSPSRTRPIARRYIS